MDYLKDEQHYIDRYDLHTIEHCLDTVRMFQEVYKKSSDNEKVKNIPEEEKIKTLSYMLHWQLCAIKAARFENKKETIQKWIAEDKLKQDKQDYTPVPENVVCSLCNGPMHFNAIKHLDYTLDNPIMRMMFLFKCSKCNKKQWVYDDGEILVSEPDLCPRCRKEITVSHIEKGKVITWKYKCKACGYSKTEVDDFAKKDKEWEEKQIERRKKEEEDKKLLEKYREEFCLSDEKGKEYVETIEAMEVANVVHEEEKRKYDDKAYQTAIKLKRLSAIELEKLLTEAVEKEKYVRLTLEKPETSQYVIVPFTVLDSVSTRRANISEYTLKKAITNALEDTNWRLMSDGVQYHLGYLSGRLRGYEHEEDLIQLSGKKQEQKLSKIDPEKIMKYSSHNLVQLARITGKHAGVETMRTRRLEKEPDGFFLEASEGPYTCGLCGENHYGNETWWTPDTLYCADCWRNIKEGVIPPLKWDKNNKIYIKDWQIKSEFSVQPMTRKKLEREGILHGRQLKRKDGTVYFTVYLVGENKKFLEKYPRKPEIDIKLYWSDKHKSLMMDAKKIYYSKDAVKKIK